MTEEEILRDRSGLDPMARYPFATSRDPGYVVGGPQMTDPRHFELMQRNREQARTQGTRLKKGGPVKKYQKGGAVEEGKDKSLSERRNLEKELARTRQRLGNMDMYPEREVDRDQTPFRPRMPSLSGRGDRSIRQQMEDERMRRDMEFENRLQRRRQDLSSTASGMESELADMGSKENKAAYKKAGGKVTAKPMGKPVMKKAGGRVAAKPMVKGRKK